MSYASILCELKKRVNSDEICTTDQGIREMRSKDLLMESLTKTPYRENKKAYVLLEEARALKFLKVAHIKIG